MALRFPYPPSSVDTRMSYLQPITSPRQANNRILPTWGGSGSGMAGCGCQKTNPATAALGALSDNMMGGGMYDIASGPVLGVYAGLRFALVAAGAYHGYARNGSVGSAIGYGLLASVFPTISMATMAVQGIAERK